MGPEELPFPSLEEGVLRFADWKAFHVTGLVEIRGCVTEEHLCNCCWLDRVMQRVIKL